ncbi:hypothetical protein P9W99_15070 [Bacillus cereus]|uniref:Uncharacterized protein n=8 Tax=root TaxID=1 RepID=I3WU25_9CAUD|nr:MULTISPECIES: hypothetical protein [Bacillus cereus group]YP_006488721.1 hypothetical protein BTCS33_gp51 [Bacillus phage BtCS33]ALN97346.1 hypothetical protein XO27_0057 [Bacillus phage phi4I1]AUO78619.1 hypothetical protein XO27_0057 [Bacillus phage BtiUFT6.51-F]AFL46442.1 hypothetical protein BtCS51 [Bacillus phage BtCS33]AGE76355.1 hypothetical protein HD73_0776 [Bacillus thuringiensis serovar kurstaki str. HD73]AHZ49527.1 hypothetical protein YBT1520_03865 [Bacillus thuringiensis sero
MKNLIKPNEVEIITSDEGVYNGELAKVVDIKMDRGEVDYRVVMGDGSEFWIPSENTVIIF